MSKALSDNLRNAGGVIDLRCPLGYRREHARQIDLLKRLAPDHGPTDLADEQNQRGRVLPGDMNAGARVCRPRSPGHHADSRPATQLAVCLRHHRRTPFLAACEEAERFPAIDERVQYRQVAFARNAEDMLRTVYEQLIHQDLPASSGRMSHFAEPLSPAAGRRRLGRTVADYIADSERSSLPSS